MTEETSSAARERVLQVAERLFSERGYHAVTLRDIANELGMKQASLYNHAPGGKEELYVTVMERGLTRHQQNIARVVAEAEPHLRAQLQAIARWLLSQPPVDLLRMSRSDLTAISETNAQHLTRLGGQALFFPIITIVEQAYRRGEIRLVEPGMMAGVFIALMDGLHESEKYTDTPAEVSAFDMIDMFIDGLARR